jgi:hypothetical protein
MRFREVVACELHNGGFQIGRLALHAFGRHGRPNKETTTPRSLMSSGWAKRGSIVWRRNDLPLTDALYTSNLRSSNPCTAQLRYAFFHNTFLPLVFVAAIEISRLIYYAV